MLVYEGATAISDSSTVFNSGEIQDFKLSILMPDKSAEYTGNLVVYSLPVGQQNSAVESETIKFTIQHPDYESEEVGPVPVGEVIGRITAHPWDAELERFENLLAEKKGDACPPSVYLGEYGKHWLHLFRDADDNFNVLINLTCRKKFLGLIPYNGTCEFSLSAGNLESALQFVKAFLERSKEQLLDDLNRGLL